jgi:hypothetical protein
MHYPSKADPVTFEASFDYAVGTVTVIQNRYAGVCGPAGTYPAEMSTVESVLFGHGYLIASDGWTPAKYDDSMYADLTPMFEI